MHLKCPSAEDVSKVLESYQKQVRILLPGNRWIISVSVLVDTPSVHRAVWILRSRLCWKSTCLILTGRPVSGSRWCHQHRMKYLTELTLLIFPSGCLAPAAWRASCGTWRLTAQSSPANKLRSDLQLCPRLYGQISNNIKTQPILKNCLISVSSPSSHLQGWRGPGALFGFSSICCSSYGSLST